MFENKYFNNGYEKFGILGINSQSQIIWLASKAPHPEI